MLFVLTDVVGDDYVVDYCVVDVYDSVHCCIGLGHFSGYEPEEPPCETGANVQNTYHLGFCTFGEDLFYGFGNCHFSEHR